MSLDTNQADAENRLSNFIRSLFGVAGSIRKNLNLRKQFKITDSEWIDLSLKINQLPWALEQGLAITPSQMLASRTIEDIVTCMIGGPNKRPALTKLAVASKGSAGGEFESLNELDNAEYSVWYGTNRIPRDQNDLAKGFSSDRDTKTHYGACDVFVPKSHKIGSTGSSWLKRTFFMTDDRLRLISTNGLQEEDFWKQLGRKLGVLSEDDRQAVIFLHGYNVTFTDAAIRAAQIGFDLSIKGAMAFFSWPSQGTLAGYPADEATIEASEASITEFLTKFVERSGSDKVHIIAHSMGNRGLLRAVQRISSRSQEETGKIFDQIILAAPDVDADVFRQLCSAYNRVSNRTTLYVSQKDRAVDSSHWLHRFPRVGFAPPVFVTQGIDTVNVTNVDISLLGHGYVAESRDVLSDIHNLITQGSPPDQRFGLKQTSINEERYWLVGA